MSESLPSVRITRNDDAPLPTRDPWAEDAKDAYRCPSCGLRDPGDRECHGCHNPLIVRQRRKRPLSVEMTMIGVVLFGCRPMLLAIAGLYQPLTAELINPQTISFAATLPITTATVFGLWLRWRWVWFFCFGFAIVDMLTQLGLHWLVAGQIVVPLAAIVIDLIVLGMLLQVYDEVKIEYQRILPPTDETMPITALDAFNRGVEYSRLGYWYIAARLWQRAVQLKHYEAPYRRALGGAYARLKLFDAAHAELAAAIAIDPHDEQSRRILSVIEQERRKGPPHELRSEKVVR